MTSIAFPSGGHVNQGVFLGKYFRTRQFWLPWISQEQACLVIVKEMLGSTSLLQIEFGIG